MWIRTQDRKQLVNCDEFKIINLGELTTEDFMYALKNNGKLKEENPNDKHAITSDMFFEGNMGEYPNLKRALEVLDEIEKAICDTKKAELFIVLYANHIVPHKDGQGPLKIVYQMPKE